jgi:hypothetical protein
MAKNEYVQPDGQDFSTATLMTMCEDTPGCGRFNSQGWLKGFATNTSVQSYLSNTTCGGVGTFQLVPGTCLSPPGAMYVTCGYGVDAFLSPVVQFNLPPYLIEQACDTNPKCAGYMVTTDQSTGWLLQYYFCTTCTGYIRVQ